jgi:hypothetical protein
MVLRLKEYTGDQEDTPMSKKFLLPVRLSLMVILAAACAAQTPTLTPTPESGLVETLVAATLTAFVPPPQPATPAPATPSAGVADLPTPTPSATPPAQPSPTPATGKISGRVCYRTQETPAMTAYFEETTSKALTELPIVAGQKEYRIDLAPGTYVVYAWLNDFSLGGLYSQAVVCGLGSECDDHTPVPIAIKAGDEIEDIDLCDWYAFSVPVPPNKPGEQIRGGLSGRIFYPDDSAPVLHIVAFNQESGYWYYVLSLAGATNYTMKDLPPGTYQVVAYTKEGQTGGYPALAIVKAGETTGGVDISAWDGNYPEDPTDW